MPYAADPTLSLRRRNYTRVLAGGLVAIAACFVISCGVALRNVGTLRDDAAKLIHSHDVIAGLDDLLSTTKDAETGQRGYLLTGDTKYLAPYNEARASVQGRIEEIATLTGDNPAQQARLAPLRAQIAAKMAELQETIDLRRTSGEAAAVAIVTTDRGKAAMDAIRGQIAAMTREEDVLRDRRIAEMASSFASAVLGNLLAAGLGLGLACVGAYLVHRAISRRLEQDWVQAGQIGLAQAMLGNKTAEQLGDGVLSYLARYLDAQAGAAYVAAGDGFERVATYGVPADAGVPQRFQRGDGLLGQAVKDARALYVRDAPAGYLTFGSALGRDKPRHIVLSPAVADGAVNAVLELGFLRNIEGGVVELLDTASAAVAAAMRSARYRSDLQRLLEETQRQAETLQVQSEELRVSNEELEEQARALKEAQARLEQSQAEIEQTNSQLEEQAGQLEIQRDDLERANSAIQLKADELERASQYKSDFLANMSHELRTPLNSLLILAKLLGDNDHDNLTPEQVKYARTIHGSGSDLLNLINDILDLSKIEAGRIEMRPETLSIRRFVDGLKSIFEPIAHERGLPFEVEIAADAPAEIETDGQRLEQVLKNLLSNAFKFTEAGKVALAIRPEGEGRLALSVTDTGIGIATEDQSGVFEAFRQADGTISRKYGGTGLGLSISRELARLLGGEIRLRSRRGEGSVFTLLIPAAYDPALVRPPEPLPVAVVEPAPAAAPRPAPAPPPPRPAEDDRDALGQGRRVLLVVEDDRTFAGILRDMAREMGFQAIVAGTAEEALRLAKRAMPSAIVLDVGLPDQSGLSVLDRLKRDVETRHIPIHIVSGSDHVQTALSLGAVGYMLKPVRREDLVDVLKKLEAKLSQAMHRVLVVEDDTVQREAVGKLLSSHDVETVGVGTAAECLARLREQTFDCMVLDLSLPDASGYSLLETLSNEEAYSFPPVIVYTGRDLSAQDEQRLRKYSKSIIIKGAKSPERLLDEVTLFLHQVVKELPSEQQKMIRQARNRDEILENRRILVVEDDVRNIYALSNILEPRGALIEIARNGREALDQLAKAARDPAQGIDLVLMDVMMPVMDGLAATREIRRDPRFKKLPVIALTAKAMPDDQQRCLDAGASDYMAKPLDVEKLLSLVRVWMPR